MEKKEEINKAIELADEEMENIAGGKAIIIFEKSNAYHGCQHSKINPYELYNHYLNPNTCKHFKRLKNGGNEKACPNCENYLNWPINAIGAADVLEDFQRRGFDVVRYPTM